MHFLHCRKQAIFKSAFWSIYWLFDDYLAYKPVLCLFESSTWQETWGKQKKSLQVTRTDGSCLTILRASSRTLLRFIP